jgi:hypothetical protein
MFNIETINLKDQFVIHQFTARTWRDAVYLFRLKYPCLAWYNDKYYPAWTQQEN